MTASELPAHDTFVAPDPPYRGLSPYESRTPWRASMQLRSMQPIMTTASQLSDDRVDAYQRDGFLILEDHLSAAQCAALRQRALELLEAFSAGDNSDNNSDSDGASSNSDTDNSVRSIFSTHEQTRTSDDYFLGSGDRIRCFFEEAAFDADGRLKQHKNLSINKIGHALHELDPIFARVSQGPELARVIDALGMRAPRLIQSMYIFKQPRIGGEVVLHQDATFLYTEPVSVVGLWMALEDATVANGCLWAMPGGHRCGLKRRFRRAAGGGTEFVTLDETPFPDLELRPLEVPAGTLVVLHGLLPHYSGANLGDRSRHAYAVHAIDSAAHYPADNWLRPSR